MIKRRKDGGFTLIELMIVIAVIGILAVVLVPKMGGVKDSAKYAGVTTNAKSVEAYVIANIDRWAKHSTDAEDLIVGQFTTAPNALANPLGGTAIIFSAPTDDAAAKGVVAVTGAATPSSGITITGYGSSATDILYQNTVRTN
ncbi:type II secretion system protein [Desulfitobacterium sp. THU1]|uniref:type II secretion system protein n=1 Tax=Desulfitobacterium sp. THU1 TaxID=3138072 RepID=UPI00311E35BA